MDGNWKHGIFTPNSQSVACCPLCLSYALLILLPLYLRVAPTIIVSRFRWFNFWQIFSGSDPYLLWGSKFCGCELPKL